MKKILSVFLATVMLLSAMVFSVSSAGSEIFSDNFDSGFKPRNWVTDPDACHFKWDGDNGLIFGYYDSVVLQPNFDNKDEKKWTTFYASYDFQIRAFDEVAGKDFSYGVGLWYRDYFDDATNGGAKGPVYTFWYDFATGTFSLKKKHDWNYKNENNITLEQTTDTVLASVTRPDLIIYSDMTGERAPYHEIGIRVTEGKIECYFEQELLLSVENNPDSVKYGDFTLDTVDESVGIHKSPVLFFNEGNYLAIDNFRVMTPDYDFVDAPAVVYGDANDDGAVNVGDATLILKHIAKWSNLTINTANADVNADGTINVGDVTLLLKYIAKWNVTLGPQA